MSRKINEWMRMKMIGFGKFAIFLDNLKYYKKYCVLYWVDIDILQATNFRMSRAYLNRKLLDRKRPIITLQAGCHGIGWEHSCSQEEELFDIIYIFVLTLCVCCCTTGKCLREPWIIILFLNPTHTCHRLQWGPCPLGAASRALDF